MALKKNYDVFLVARCAASMSRLKSSTKHLTHELQGHCRITADNLVKTAIVTLDPNAAAKRLAIDASFSLRHFHQTLNIEKFQSFPFRFDDPLRFPLVEQATHGKYGCAGELGQIALRHRDFDVTEGILTATGNVRAVLLVPDGDCDDECEAEILANEHAAATSSNGAKTSTLSPQARAQFRQPRLKHN